MQKGFVRAYQILIWIILAVILLQFLLAGLNIFEVASLDPHRINGGLVILASLLLLIVTLVGRLPSLIVSRTALLFGQLVLQLLLIW